MASLKCGKLAAFIIFAAKTHSKIRLLQYIITAKNPFKTSIDALLVMLLNFKKTYATRFSSASLMACRKIH